MSKTIKISAVKRNEYAKTAQTEEAYRQREAEILTYEWKNPFSYFSWYEAWKSGWLKQHGLGIHSFPSPILHHKKMWKKSNSDFYKMWRKEAREKHQIFLEKRRGK